MRIVSFNTNGIRARPHQLEALRDKYDPDVIGIQETKAQDKDFPLEMVESLGYHAEFFGQKSHYGVALLSKNKPLEVTKGFPGDEEDAQRRAITATFEINGQQVSVFNGYFPQGESRDHETKFPNKQKFYADLNDFLETTFRPEQHLVVIGDMNIAPLDLDIGIGADNAKRWLKTGKCSFLPEEREWLDKLAGWGLHDTYRTINPEVDDQFSWFDYRSRGFEREPKRGLRIDLILATASLNEKCSRSGIAYDIRAMEKPSDHCPIWSDFDIG
ncbi:MAG: exodeoxyribonuclease III [Gammaproteobacteria bacterium]|nr:exodeoxyribonuclease III [Gammaproteobacteria bacterium]NNJ92454.1 exodeoxyribonuclease III [Gammaproteobacteria bacterium]